MVFVLIAVVLLVVSWWLRYSDQESLGTRWLGLSRLWYQRVLAVALRGSAG